MNKDTLKLIRQEIQRLRTVDEEYDELVGEPLLDASYIKAVMSITTRIKRLLIDENFTDELLEYNERIGLK